MSLTSQDKAMVRVRLELVELVWLSKWKLRCSGTSILLYGEKSSYIQFTQSQSCFLLAESTGAALWNTRPFQLWTSHLNKVTCVMFVAEEQGPDWAPKKCWSDARWGSSLPPWSFLDFIVKEHLPSSGSDFQTTCNARSWLGFPTAHGGLVCLLRKGVDLCSIINLSSNFFSHYVAGWIRLQIVRCPTWWITAMAEPVANPVLVISPLRCTTSVSVTWLRANLITYGEVSWELHEPWVSARILFVAQLCTTLRENFIPDIRVEAHSRQVVRVHAELSILSRNCINPVGLWWKASLKHLKILHSI